MCVCIVVVYMGEKEKERKRDTVRSREIAYEKAKDKSLEKNWGVQFGVSLELIFVTNSNFAHMCYCRYDFMEQQGLQS